MTPQHMAVLSFWELAEIVIVIYLIFYNLDIYTSRLVYTFEQAYTVKLKTM